jgi:hypothetical protein
LFCLLLFSFKGSINFIIGLKTNLDSHEDQILSSLEKSTTLSLDILFTASIIYCFFFYILIIILFGVPNAIAFFMQYKYIPYIGPLIAPF